MKPGSQPSDTSSLPREEEALCAGIQPSPVGQFWCTLGVTCRSPAARLPHGQFRRDCFVRRIRHRITGLSCGGVGNCRVCPLRNSWLLVLSTPVGRWLQIHLLTVPSSVCFDTVSARFKTLHSVYSIYHSRVTVHIGQDNAVSRLQEARFPIELSSGQTATTRPTRPVRHSPTRPEAIEHGTDSEKRYHAVFI